MISDGPFLIGVDNIQEMLPTILTDSIVLRQSFYNKGNQSKCTGFTRLYPGMNFKNEMLTVLLMIKVL